MHYEINVSKNGKHFFATHERSLRGFEQTAQKMARLFKEKFPEEEGYKVTMTRWATSGTSLEVWAAGEGCGRSRT